MGFPDEKLDQWDVDSENGDKYRIRYYFRHACEL